MADLSTTYMGLALRNPLIIGSSGLTNSLENIREIEKKGAGAVVLKSLFEEQIKYEIRKVFSYDEAHRSSTEAEDYIRNYARSHSLEKYTKLIRDAKSSVSIPIIASINCISASEWPAFATNIQEAGADALELNIFVLPSDINSDGRKIEQIYFDILEAVRSKVTIPVSLKLSHHFSGLGEMIKKFSWTGVKGIVLFNRFFNPDIDIDSYNFKPGNIYSTPEEITGSLRWIAILADRVQCDLCASTGIHDSGGLIKQLLAGAKAGQVCSVLYKKGFDEIEKILGDMRGWMEKHNYAKIDDFRGKMSYKKSENPAAYYRVQFMKHFAGID